MKKTIINVISLLFVLGFSGVALGATLNSGVHISDYPSPNDWETTVEGMLTGVDLVFIAKEEFDDDVKSGKSKLSQLVYYYTVKAGNDFALYEISGGLYDVSWANETIKNPNNTNNNLKDVSHVTFWGIPTPTNPVPIPASVLLLGSGLIGVVGLGKKRKESA
ncbi:exported hypothetical protein [Desulfamplus magnetovallimortis]|uniref:PEP-CTERM protein-sorting domain-containing protein n=1 Tax=Desulfamplus magnetovallimortis TaxID=1246637 RepID=A0A1W1HE31_9BACT|nr:VPLPA-CTERM sorting domain-containing protein [Desulfamplus magnetovallimortis]SLM30648.1 exported hypothetical protein [Desulfamplus magnetovallimortis]